MNALLIGTMITLALAGCAQAAEVPAGFALIRGGSFVMGSPDTEAWREKDEVQHQVSVSDFYMAKCELTQGEYEKTMTQNPSAFHGVRLPVENISWLEAVEYCNRRSQAEGLKAVYKVEGQNVSWDRAADGYRLPTEAEWEYACRSGTKTPFNTETSISPEESNYYGHYPYMIEANYFNQEKLSTQPGRYRETTVAVGSFKPNKWGLYDMHGNVEEWCWDYYGPYAAENRDPAGPAKGSLRINRGGGWNDFAKHMRSAYRSSALQESRSRSLGFRLARNVVSGNGVFASSAAFDANRSASAGRVLIAYFSWGGTTRGIAEQIQRQTGADLFEIQCSQLYSTSYEKVLDQAQHDQFIQARPKLRTHVKDIARYDTVLLGYPNWWASIPMPIASFLEEYNLAGKRIVPFCSNGGGRFGQSLSAIAKLAPRSVLAEGLTVHYSGGPNLSDEIVVWLKRNGVKRK